jgi:hypothetical protein
VAGFEQVEQVWRDGVQAAFPLLPAALGRRSGFQLLSWTQDTIDAVPPVLPAPKPKRKHTLLPVLIVLFLVSYGLMAMLVVEQDRTIGSQRALITSLFSDSTELTTLKGKLFQQQHPQAGQGTRSQAQPPSSQSPMAQAPMTQDAPGANAQSSRNASKLRKPLPQKPPLGIADVVDGRRIMKSI